MACNAYHWNCDNGHERKRKRVLLQIRNSAENREWVKRTGRQINEKLRMEYTKIAKRDRVKGKYGWIKFNNNGNTVAFPFSFNYLYHHRLTPPPPHSIPYMLVLPQIHWQVISSCCSSQQQKPPRIGARHIWVELRILAAFSHELEKPATTTTTSIPPCYFNAYNTRWYKYSCLQMRSRQKLCLL